MADLTDGLKNLSKPAVPSQIKKPKVTKVDLGKAGSFKVHPGKLHEALGVPKGEKLGQSRIAKAEKSKNPEIRKMADSAEGLTHMGKG
jgi:hypothetical protein